MNMTLTEKSDNTEEANDLPSVLAKLFLIPIYFLIFVFSVMCLAGIVITLTSVLMFSFETILP